MTDYDPFERYHDSVPFRTRLSWALRLWLNSDSIKLGEFIAFLMFAAFIVAVFMIPETTAWLP